MMGGGLVHAALALALVIGLIYALAWLLRRLSGNRLLRGGADSLQVVSSISLGNKERAVLVAINRQQVLLGVASGSVSLLHVLPPTEPETHRSSPIASPRETGIPSFMDRLRGVNHLFSSDNPGKTETPSFVDRLREAKKSFPAGQWTGMKEPQP